MKRFHVHVATDDLDASIQFYSAVLGAEPTVVKTDYAKWMLDDPRINFAVSKRGHKSGVNHLGIQVDSDAELEALREQIERAESAVLEQKGEACCYAESDKYWTTDPQGIAWESFHSLANIPVFGNDTDGQELLKANQSPCCVPASSAKEKMPVQAARVDAACCGPKSMR